MRYYIFIFLIIIGCGRINPIHNGLAPNYSNISDSIKNQLIQAYNEDTNKPKPPFLTWLNLNGGYILALNYINDSLQLYPSNRLAMMGDDIAYQHGYMNKAIDFLNRYQPVNEKDSLELWFRELMVYQAKRYTMNDDDILDKINGHLNYIKSDEYLNFLYMSALGWHYHIHEMYDSAIKYNQIAYNKAHNGNYSQDDIAMTCQRLGNDYNDLIRLKLIPESAIKSTYEQSKSLYLECLSELNQIIPVPKEKIANCLFTYNFLIKETGYMPDTVKYYKNALELLIPNYNTRTKDDPFLCLNPTLASITLNHLGFLYYLNNQNNKSTQNEVNCLKYSEECLKLFNEVILDPEQDDAFTDMIETYGQVNTSNLICYYKAILPSEPNLIYKLLYFSNSSKYVSLIKNHLICQTIGEQDRLKLKHLAELHSMNFVAYSTGNMGLRNIVTRLKGITKSINPSHNFLLPQVTPEVVNKLKDICKKENALIIDFNLPRGHLLTTIIDKDTIFNDYASPDNSPITFNISDTLIMLMHENDVKKYKEKSMRIYEFLFKRLIDVGKYKKLIIIPCINIDQIPFDALVTECKYTSNWSELNYLSDKVDIQTVPSLQWLLESNLKPSEFRISYLQTEFTGSQSLPYNDELKEHLKSNYRAKVIDDNKLESSITRSEDILHIATHTEKDAMGYISLTLNHSHLRPDKGKTRQYRLAVLNACETNAGIHFQNEGEISLTRLFLSSGADAVITSKGNVDNHASSELFKAFYKYLYQGKPASESLGLAKKDIRKITPEWANPYYWSMYELFGSDLTFYH